MLSRLPAAPPLFTLRLEVRAGAKKYYTTIFFAGSAITPPPRTLSASGISFAPFSNLIGFAVLVNTITPYGGHLGNFPYYWQTEPIS